MSKQPDQEKQPSEILTPEEMRQSTLAEVEVSDELLMEITGGGSILGTLGNIAMNACCDPISAAGSVAGAALGGITGAVRHGNIAHAVSTGSMIGSFADPFGGVVKGIGKSALKGTGKAIGKGITRRSV
jgi:hypothetical protein